MTAAEKLIAEFIGTFMLVLTVGCNVITGGPEWAVTSIACTLMVMIYALGGVSGANFNPAVTVALGMAKKIPQADIGPYIGVQVVAGICAGLVYGGMFLNVFNLAPAAGFTWIHAALAEIIYTFMLCFVVLNCAASKMHPPGSGRGPAGQRENQFYGIAIGFVVIAGGYGAGHISGGCFNPAVAIGIDTSSAGIGWGWCLAYTIFELIGAAIAVGLFQACRPEEKHGEEVPPPTGLYPITSRLISEFLGTYMLVLTVGLNVIGGSKAPVWSIAASLMCMIFALGSCSGAHFNPAVTVAISLSGRGQMAQTDVLKYIGAQIVGGILASFTYAIMEKGAVFPLQPGAGHTWISAYLAEMVFTFLLCFVVLSVATVKEPLEVHFGLAIGSCVTAGGYAIGAVSGGSLNPAVSTGIALSSLAGGHGIFHLFPYIIFELIGAVIATVLFKVTHEDEYDAPTSEYAPQYGDDLQAPA
jgi:aquaporin Z